MRWGGFSFHYLGLESLQLTDRDQTVKLIDRTDKAIEKISKIRSTFGAYINRMEHMYNIDMNSAENLQNSESNMRDADMAEEMVAFSRSNILQQAAQSMLAQANKSMGEVLSLLQQ